MAGLPDQDELRQQSQELIAALAGDGFADVLESAKAAVSDLCTARLYEPLCDLSEAIYRRDPDPTIRRLYAQALIERGYVTVAIEVLKSLSAHLGTEHPELAEATGLLGRCYKQIFFDAEDKEDARMLAALMKAIKIYRDQYEKSPSSSWHGINYIALMHRARQAKLEIAETFDIEHAAAALIDTLEAVPVAERDAWHAPTLAEAHLARREWDAVEKIIGSYARTDAPFQIASTIRQLNNVWDVEALDPERGPAILSALRARLVELEGSGVQLTAAELAEERQRLDDNDIPTFEALLGNTGTSLYTWWKTGLERASSVASIRVKGGFRVGTGFVVKAADLGLPAAADDFVVITNFHVVADNAVGVLRPRDVEIVFEASVDQAPRDISEVLWSSPPDMHDITVLRLAGGIPDVPPLPLDLNLPQPGPDTRVYVIGHPGGRELAFSFQDNQLLDHEGPPDGQPEIDGVVRLHYRAPTEGGSSGSPVFNALRWEVIAVHHAGAKHAISKLNCNAGTYSANEGISVASIRDAILEELPASGQK